MKSMVQSVLESYNSDATRLMDILIDVQEEQGYLPPPVLAEIIAAIVSSSYVCISMFQQRVIVYPFNSVFAAKTVVKLFVFGINVLSYIEESTSPPKESYTLPFCM